MTACTARKAPSPSARSGWYQPWSRSVSLRAPEGSASASSPPRARWASTPRRSTPRPDATGATIRRPSRTWRSSTRSSTSSMPSTEAPARQCRSRRGWPPRMSWTRWIRGCPLAPRLVRRPPNHRSGCRLSHRLRVLTRGTVKERARPAEGSPGLPPRPRRRGTRLARVQPQTRRLFVAVTQTKPAERTSAPPKRTLADLAHGPEAIRLLVDAVLDYAIFLIGPDGNVLTWNQGAERIKGYQAHEVIGKHISIFYTAEDVEAGRPERILRQAARQGRAYDEGWRLRKDGTRFWADASVHALYDHGRLYGFAKITRDMTDARAAAERERQL